MLCQALQAMTAVLALLSSVVWGGSDFLGGTLTRRAHAVAVVGGSQVIALLAVLPVALLTGGFAAPTGYLPWAVAAGLVGMVSLIGFYAALATGTMGVVAPIAATGVVVPVAIGLLTGDRPAPVQLVGVVCAVTGVVLASGPELRAVNTHQASGGARSLVLAVLAAVGFGLVLWLLRGGGRYSVVMTLLTQRSASLVMVLVLVVVTRSTGGLGRADLPLLALIGVGDATANGLYTTATRSGLISLVAVLGSLYPVVTVLLARVVHGERMRRIQNAGVSVALVGVVLIASGGF
jgi:drug/metabolite transporter (DMT)-like permease